MLLVFALLASAGVTSASAGTLNTRSDRKALVAYDTYLRALIARVPLASRRDQSLIAATARTCPGYLAPYAKHMTYGSGRALGAEVGGDLAVRFTSAAWRPFRRLSVRLGRLRWSSEHAVLVVGRFLNAERWLIRMRPSNLCGDVIDLGSHPRYVGPGTRRFDRRLTRVTNRASAALTAFIRVLESYEASGDSRIISRINHHYSVYASRTNAVEGPARTQLLTTIGIRALS